MKLVDIKDSDYDDVVVLGKELLNFDYLLTQKNDSFNDTLSKLVISSIVSDATNGSFLETENGKKIGMIVYKIPNLSNLFASSKTDSKINVDLFKKYIRDFGISKNERLIVNKEIAVAKAFDSLFLQHQKLFMNKAEIKLLYLDHAYRGKFLSKSLWLKFYDDLSSNSFFDCFYLFTTTEHNFRFYEKIKMQGVDTVVYDEINCPEFLKYKFKLPYKAMVFFGSKKEIIF